jgi:hypothetical protein
MYGVGSANRVDAHLGEADRSNVSCRNQLADRADGFLDRNGRVQAGGPVD